MFKNHTAVFILAINSVVGSAKTVQLLVEDPFDVGSGGSVLTRGSQEGQILSNPALLGIEGPVLRWSGIRTSVSAAQESIDLGQSLAQDLVGGDVNLTAISESALDSTVHVGFTQTVAALTQNFGFLAFGSTEPDVRIWSKGNPDTGTGVPELFLRSETYSGAVVAGAVPVFIPQITLGVAGKYLLVSDEVKQFVLVDSKIAERIVSNITPTLSTGYGADCGLLIAARSSFLDFNIGATAVNAYASELAGETPPMFVNGGFSIVFHTYRDALQISADYRDVLDTYGEPEFKRMFVGAKLLIRKYVGIGAGLYHGSLSYGFEIDLVALRLSGAYYTREYGSAPGVDSRSIYVASLAVGVGQ